jgi:hypothetical protein
MQAIRKEFQARCKRERADCEKRLAKLKELDVIAGGGTPVASAEQLAMLQLFAGLDRRSDEERRLDRRSLEDTIRVFTHAHNLELEKATHSMEKYAARGRGSDKPVVLRIMAQHLEHARWVQACVESPESVPAADDDRFVSSSGSAVQQRMARRQQLASKRLLQTMADMAPLLAAEVCDWVDPPCFAESIERGPAILYGDHWVTSTPEHPHALWDGTSHFRRCVGCISVFHSADDGARLVWHMAGSDLCMHLNPRKWLLSSQHLSAGTGPGKNPCPCALAQTLLFNFRAFVAMHPGKTTLCGPTCDDDVAKLLGIPRGNMTPTAAGPVDVYHDAEQFTWEPSPACESDASALLSALASDASASALLSALASDASASALLSALATAE